MIKPLLFLLLFLTVLNGFSQNKKQRKRIPPGTVQINDTLFADQTEVANVHWREYIHFLNKLNSPIVESMLPDTTVWRDTLVLNENPATQFYFRHPGFNAYPVVGISYEQAIAFCNWRTHAANFVFYCKENNIENREAHIRDSFPIKFYYRLPTKQEWEALASGKLNIDTHTYGYDSVYQKWRGKKYYKSFNCIYSGKPDSSRSFYTSEVKSFWPNTYSIYNTIGNVAEMVAEKGIAKGGSFAHTLEECRIINNQHYIKPERWLGFRCVAVLLK